MQHDDNGTDCSVKLNKKQWRKIYQLDFWMEELKMRLA